MEITGLLNNISVQTLLEQAESEEQTGILFLKSDLGVGEVQFENGLIYFADAPLSRDKLGHALVSEGVMHPSEYYQTIREHDSESNRFETSLLENHILSSDQVTRVIEQQIEEAVLHLMMWKEGSFAFKRSAPKNSHPVYLRPQHLMEKGKNRLSELTSLSSKSVIQRIREHPDPLIHQHLFQKIEQLHGRAKSFEPRVVALLVENDAKWRMMVQEEMTRQNFHVKGVSNTEKAEVEIEHMLSKGLRPIVLTDIDFPRQQNATKLAGLSFMEGLHKKYPQIPIVVCTSYPISNLRRKILFSGGIFCLIKPDLSILSSKNFEEIFQSFIRELVYCLDYTIQQIYQEYFQERSEILQNELIEDLYNTKKELMLFGEKSIEDAGIHEAFYRISNMLVREGDIDGAIDALFEFMAGRYDHVALFLWGKKYVNGYFGRSRLRADFSEKIKNVSVEYEKIPLLNKLYDEKTIFQGPPTEGKEDLNFLRNLQKEKPQWQLLYPIEVMGKVVALWYADVLKIRERDPYVHVMISLVNLIALSLKMDLEHQGT